VKAFAEKMDLLGISYSLALQRKGRKATIAGKSFESMQDVRILYNSTKGFAQQLISFGVPAGNKSTKYSLGSRILTYGDETIANFLRGVFDGDGSIRNDPFEVTLTTGIEENARLFQLMLTRLGIVSSVKKSLRSWHCDVRGTASCLEFMRKIGTNHPEKMKRFDNIFPVQEKDRLDVLPNHQRLFRNIIKKHTLGKETYRYVWNYVKEGVCPSKSKLRTLNKKIGDPELTKHLESDVLWDSIVSIEEVEAEYVYDFTMKGTDNFIANNIIMHNCIDELDKMNKEDTSAMHEALEQQQVSIAPRGDDGARRREPEVRPLRPVRAHQQADRSPSDAPQPLRPHLPRARPSRQDEG
jgi:hypothetical protein